MKKQKITISRAHSQQGVGGILIPLEAKVVDVSLDSMDEHGQVVYYVWDEVEVDDDGKEAS